MTSTEAKQAFLKQCPVVDENPQNRDKIVYKCISLVGFKMLDGKPVLVCICQDRNTNSTTLTLPKHLSVYEGESL